MSESVIIATSIAPGKIELQQAAIASWRKLGFKVLSVNTSSEIDLLKNSFPQLHFVAAQRDASSVAGRPFIYLDDILHALKASGAGVCGIVNSDIHLMAGDDFCDFIRENASDGFVFGARVDVESLDTPEGELYEEGFDYFFFKRDVIAAFPLSDFCLGAPWWDYWAPLVPIMAGVPTKELLAPVAFHLTHEANWDGQLYESFGRRLLQYFSENSSKNASDNLTAGPDVQMLELLELPKRGRYISNWIKQKSGCLFYQQRVAADAVCNVDKQQYLEMRGKFLKSVGSYLQSELTLASVVVQLRESEADRTARLEVIHQRDLQLIELDKHVKAMEASLSWRTTKLLRWFHAKVAGSSR